METQNFNRWRKIRKKWNILPVTKVIKSKKAYSRQLSKKQLNKIIKEVATADDNRTKRIRND